MNTWWEEATLWSKEIGLTWCSGDFFKSLRAPEVPASKKEGSLWHKRHGVRNSSILDNQAEKC